MGHRHVFSPSYIFETENDQRWNLTEHPCADIAPSDAAESSSLAYPADNMPIDGAHYASHCNLAPVSNIYSSLTHNTQNSHYQQDTAGPSTLPIDPSLRGFYKRKNPDVPDGCERTVTNGYNHDAGSSTDVSMSTDSWNETPNMDVRTPWDYPNMKSGGENSVRNVRSRTAFDSEANLTSSPFSNGLSLDYYTTSPTMDISSSGDHLDQRLKGTTKREWNPTHMPPNHDSGSIGHESNPFLVGSSSSSPSVESAGHSNGLLARSNHIPQDFHGTPMQSVIGNHSNYIQRSAPTFRASSSSLVPGHAVASDEGLPLATDSYSSRHPRPFSTIAWRSSYRNARTRMSIERFRSFSEEANFHDLPAPEGLMIMERSAFYGSRNPFDNHRELRLDIDDMSYEELLALGERIGSVSTGLSDDLISKCLQESIYCSSDQKQNEGKCVICLEEYANMDDVGMLKGCSHDFHVGCIKKWLSMKNLCPICKSEPMKPHK